MPTNDTPSAPDGATLAAAVSKAMRKLDPGTESDGPPAMRLRALARRAASGFPILVIEFHEATGDWGGHEPADARMATHIVRDAVALTGLLADIHGREPDDLLFYRLAPNSRSDGEGGVLLDHCEDSEIWGVVTYAEKEIIDRRVRDELAARAAISPERRRLVDEARRAKAALETFDRSTCGAAGS